MRWIFVLALAVMMSPGEGIPAMALSARSFQRALQPRSGGPNISPPFSTPGQIQEGFPITDIVEASGAFWTADTVLEGGAQVCDRLGPAVRASLIGAGAEQTVVVDKICGLFESPNVEEYCGTLWDQVVVLLANREDLIDGSHSIIPGMRCWENDYDYPFPTDFGGMNVSVIPEVSKRIAAGVVNPNDLNPYDPCSEKGIGRVNNIIFALADWIGSPVFEPIYVGGDDPYFICELMRFILSMNVRDAIQQAIGILKFPLADILETLQPLDICTLIGELAGNLDEVELEAFAIFKAVLEQLSGLSEEEFCDFLSEEQTREAYLEQAETIISNAIFLIHDRPRCVSILEIIAPADTLGEFYVVTGFNISIESERNEFCTEFVDAYDLSSSYVPPPFEIPSDVDINDFTPFETPGVILPGLTFIDLMRLDGVGYRSELFIDAVAAYCDVFEDFIASQIEEEQFDIRGFCLGARHRALGVMEEFCLAETVPARYGEDRPLGLRPFNLPAVYLYIVHVITGIDDISKAEICPAADSLLNEHSASDLTAEQLDILLTEALPAAHGLCQNWEAALCYLKPFCPIPEPPATTEEPEVTRPPWLVPYRPYVPSPEVIEEANAGFDFGVAGLTNILLLMSGFDGREEACAFVASSIDPLSGRGDGSNIAVVRDAVLGIVHDVDRCSRIIDAFLAQIPEEARQDILTGGNTNFVYQLTGYQTSREFCQVVAQAYAEEGGPQPPLPPGPGGEATYNVVANIVLHIQRVARSIV